MSGIGFSELVLLFIIGLLILGPERLPRVATQIGRWVGRARRTANQLRYQLEREIALADIRKPPPDDKPDKTSSSKPKASDSSADEEASDETIDPTTSTSDENGDAAEVKDDKESGRD